MPYLPKRPCSKRDCPALVEHGKRFCIEHQREYDREYARTRPSSAKRGYGQAWQKFRKWFLMNRPYCEIKLLCKGDPATEVDHIQKPKGPNDPMFYEIENLRAVCKRCHSSKSARFDNRWGKKRDASKK